MASWEPRDPMMRSLITHLQSKHTADGIDFAPTILGAGGAADFGNRTVGHLGHQGLSKHVERLFLLRRHGAEFAAEPLQLGLAELFQVLLELDDDWGGLAHFQAGDEVFDLFGYDGLGGGGLAFAAFAILVDAAAHVVNIVEEDVFQRVAVGIDIARHRYIDKEYRTALAFGADEAHLRLGEDVVGRAGGGDDDVDVGHDV